MNEEEAQMGRGARERVLLSPFGSPATDMGDSGLFGEMSPRDSHMGSPAGVNTQRLTTP